MKVKEVADLIFGYMHQQVIKSLEAAQGDRVLKVRQAAMLAKQQWQLVKCINKELESKKQNQELRGLSPDELIKARTGYGDMDDLRQGILNEVQQSASPDLMRVVRPQTAESNSLKGSVPKKFKMLKELARLNQELRVQKPYVPSAQA